MRRPGTRAALTVAIIAAVAALASCAAPAPQGSGQPTQPSGTASSPGTGSASPSPVRCPGDWHAGPLTVTRHLAVPPVPVAAAIRTGSHQECRFDRLVIDLRTAVPGYTVSFASKVTMDPSGRTLSMPGVTYLLVHLSPAQGHTASGQPTLPAGVQVTGYPMLKAYAVSGDFEGHLTIALGLARSTNFRVGELPGRLYVDLSW